MAAVVASLLSILAALAAACESQPDQCKPRPGSRGGVLIQQASRTFRGDDQETPEKSQPGQDWLQEFLTEDVERLRQLDLQQVRAHRHSNTAASEASMLVTAVKGNDVIEIDMDPSGKATWQQISLGHGKTFKIRAPQPSVEFNIANVVSTVLITMLAAFYFKQEMKMWPEVEPNADPAELKDWSTGGMACFSDMPTCLCACCCLPVVWADNTDMVGYMKFWIAFAACLFLRAACAWPAVSGVAYLIMIVMFTLFRRHLRKIFDMPGRDCGGLVCDTCFICCCMCCAIAQEARHIQDASRAGHPRIERPMVGEAVQAARRAPM